MKVAINGLGRIGRHVLKIGLEKKVNFVAINDLASPEQLAYLLKYDSVYGNFPGKISHGKDFLKINGKKIKVYSERDPELLPWDNLKVDLVIEATGKFKLKRDAERHIEAGAKKVLITAASKSADVMIVLGVNDKALKKNHKIVSMASCTTNCLAPIVKVLDSKFKIQKGFMTTVHGYTSSQGLIDVAHHKFRRGRSAGINLVPTSSGATSATEIVLPKLRGKIDGLAIRAPIPVGSIVDFVVTVSKKTNIKDVNNALRIAAKKSKGIIQYSEDELVSTDILGNPHSSIVDSSLTQVKGNLVKVLSWYDNEWGYSNRIVELAKKMR